jgi:hypothetical protein
MGMNPVDYSASIAGDAEKLREAYGVSESDDDSGDTDDDVPDPTHECRQCSWMQYIESSPTSDYHYCPICERVTEHLRLDRENGPRND